MDKISPAQEALLAGAAGALALNVTHESARHLITNAPRVHEVAMRAMRRFVLDPLGVKMSRRGLYWTTLSSDFVSNSLYFAAVVGAFGRRDTRSVWTRAVIFGAGAGVLAVALPPMLNLGQQRTRNFTKTATLTTAWYLLGALVAAGVSQMIVSED